jgi:hypothetical protein
MMRVTAFKALWLMLGYYRKMGLWALSTVIYNSKQRAEAGFIHDILLHDPLNHY